MVNNEKYVSFLERLINITHIEPFDREAYVELMREICIDYNLAKGETEFYPTPLMETMGKGEIYCDFDDGKACKVLLRLRIVSPNKAVVIGTLYTDSEDDERSDEELNQLASLLKVILGFVSRRRLLRKLEEFGFYDLSGFLNYRALLRYLDIANIENKLGGKIAFHFDIHNFAMVNQEIGRDMGDNVLLNYYIMIQKAIGDNGIIIRLGGDKFVGVFDRKVKRAVYELFSGVPVSYDESGEKKIKISAAVGVYMLPNPFMLKSHGELMDKIMIASGVAKRQSGSSIVVYDEKMKQNRNHLKKVQAEYRDAMKNEEFVVYYQPKVDIETKQLSGAEALCRWIRNGKVIPPMEFIPILEMSTDICDLDFYMLEHVCKDIRRWLDEGRDVVRVSVNFSRKHLVDVNLLDHIISAIDKYNVPHEYIEVELTETTTDVLFRDLKRVVCGLQEQGIWTAVDDFGVGFSSLKLIRDLPWNVLKVDKSFVPSSEEDIDSIPNKMFKHVISLAHDLGLKCVIEGVETVDQLDILRRNGCSMVQGYFFDQPLPVEEFEMRLDQKYYEVP